MPHPQPGDTVKIHCTGRLKDGHVFTATRARADPLEIIVGEGHLIPALETLIFQMEPGEERTITVPPDQAYGEHRADLYVSVDRAELPASLSPEIGQQLQVSGDRGETRVVTVVEVDDAQVVIDANHPLAGETLTFDLQLLEIQPKSTGN